MTFKSVHPHHWNKKRVISESCPENMAWKPSTRGRHLSASAFPFPAHSAGALWRDVPRVKHGNGNWPKLPDAVGSVGCESPAKMAAVVAQGRKKVIDLYANVDISSGCSTCTRTCGRDKKKDELVFSPKYLLRSMCSIDSFENANAFGSFDKRQYCTNGQRRAVSKHGAVLD